jgi:hypothetical protein
LSLVTAGHLKAGIIFGDSETQEYIYMPGGEVGIENPICILERNSKRRDITLKRPPIWYTNLL